MHDNQWIGFSAEGGTVNETDLCFPKTSMCLLGKKMMMTVIGGKNSPKIRFCFKQIATLTNPVGLSCIPIEHHRTRNLPESVRA